LRIADKSLYFPALACKTAPDSRLAGEVPPPYHPPPFRATSCEARHEATL